MGGQIEDAIELLRHVRSLGLEPGVRAYHVILKRCAEHGRWDAAVHLLAEMREDGLEPDVPLYTAAIEACAAAGQVEWTLSLVDEVVNKEGLYLDPVAYHAMLGALSSLKAWDWVRALIRMAIEAGVPIRPERYTAALQACAESGDWEMAMALLDMSLDKQSKLWEPDYCDFNYALVAYNKAGLPERASEFYRELLARGVWSPWVSRDTIDLHSMATETATIAVREAVRQSAAEARGLNIVVGTGLHSKEGVPVLRSVVLELLAKEFGLEVGTKANNKGVFVVRQAEILKLVSRQRRESVTEASG